MLNFKELEGEAEKIASKEDIKRAVANDKKRKKTFSFLEGPPTANAPPALHHLEVRTYKDIINKFRYMQGFNVPRKAGWDCHGLPVEVQIERKLKLNSKKDILKYGEANFIKECRESVFSYIKDWNKSTERLGYWVDLEKPYRTLDNDYIESVWWSLKQLYEKDLLYEDKKVVPFCPRCETPLSTHEVAQGYKKVKEESVVVKFRIKDREEYLLVWTTTPWTLPANVGIAVNPDLEYAYVKDREIYVVAKALAEKLFDEPEIIKVVKGKELVGMHYTPLFPYYEGLKGAFKVIAGDFVTTEEGTGLVHMAPAFGEIDFDACKKEGIPIVQPVDERGRFTDEVPDYAGEFIKDTDKKIIMRLEQDMKLFKAFKYEHDYPFCWRCDSPLMYYAIQSWFIKVTKYKEKLIKLNEKINWVPNHIKEGRFGEWLKNVKDWALSRKKFWGTPLPIWRCECGNEEIIGSIEELKKKSAEKIKESEIDLHKPWIDGIKLKCKKCGKNMSRLNDVIDCWYDSGSASFAQFHYPFENKAEFKKRFPYDFIAEAIDQTRGWFYTLHVIGALLFDDITYKNVICAGLLVDEKGEKMSKSKGNIINPDEVMNEVGVDATRLQFCVTDISESKRLGIAIVKQDIWPFLNILWNSQQYYLQLVNQKKGEKRIEDEWILSRLNSLVKKTTESLEEYNIEKALLPIIDFVVNDFSRGYIRLVREREDENVKKVVGEILDKVSRILAPYAPNISNLIYQKIAKKGNVHSSKWAEYDKKKIKEKLEKEFGHMFKIIELGLSERDKAQIGLKWPLSEAKIYCEIDFGKNTREIIAKQLNVKKLSIKKSKEIKVELDTKITPELEAEGFSRELARKIQDERKKAGLKKGEMIRLKVYSDEKTIKMFEKFLKFLRERTNSKEIEFVVDKNIKKGDNVFTVKERTFAVEFS